ncbi:hypothetical protein PR202_gb21486 [Eleusine coracana subsp. coracana]|uniref:C2H2-type domain-containing protein n=1 Tax=Eleusine coracana subsp. coracana TaxID=191504 RepID=A0AAV5FF97_ELECO|nr:hypothetical protein PR202_gb21486 [Eleusine coracana subsp. coracana]
MAFAAAAARQEEEEAGAKGHNNRGHGAPSSPQPSASASSSSEAPQHQHLNFRCALCGKAFASYRALGGHMASHRKPYYAPPARNNGTAVPFPRNASGAAPVSAAGGGGRHVCTVCGRRFATGQALGGHKRFHYLHGPSVSAASLASAAAAGSRMAVGFDLNLPPTMASEIALAAGTKREEEEEEVQSPAGLPPAKKPRRHSNSSSTLREAQLNSCNSSKAQCIVRKE